MDSSIFMKWPYTWQTKTRKTLFVLFYFEYRSLAKFILMFDSTFKLFAVGSGSFTKTVNRCASNTNEYENNCLAMQSHSEVNITLLRGSILNGECCGKLIESVSDWNWPDRRKARQRWWGSWACVGHPRYLAINKTVKGWWLSWPSSLSRLVLAGGLVDMWQTQSFGKVALLLPLWLGLCVTGGGGMVSNHQHSTP